ncbi:MAG: hypothetical protein LBM75_03400 [Myxococcales bacterium]|jgi:putative N6-adenine-specific DNA methylase|nr:hypothetical protein [Myxococcales bacterium]
MRASTVSSDLDAFAFASAAPGLEQLLAFELRRLGLRGVRAEPGGVAFRASAMDDVRRANLWLRTAHRILMRVAEFRADSFSLLEQKARSVEWPRWLAPGARVALSVTCHKSRLYHSTAVAERVASAIGRRVPGLALVALNDAEEASEAEAFVQRVFVRLDHDHCTLSLDTSGEHLHRRGYRRAIGEAPLRETLAAAMILSGGLQARVPGLAIDHATPVPQWLVDPMCGSGTLPIEAARLLCNVAPGRDRAFAFQRWPDDDPTRWRALLDDARSREIALPEGFVIEASDIDAEALRAARLNAAAAGLAPALIDWHVRPLDALPSAKAPGVLLSNPPYGHRLGDARDLRNFYRTAGRIFRERRSGSKLGLLLPDRGFEALLGIAVETKFQTRNGGIPVHLSVADL